MAEMTIYAATLSVIDSASLRMLSPSSNGGLVMTSGGSAKTICQRTNAHRLDYLQVIPISQWRKRYSRQCLVPVSHRRNVILER